MASRRRGHPDRCTLLAPRRQASAEKKGAKLSDNEHPIADLVSGILLGALAGGGIGFGACVFIFEDTLLFTGDTVLFGALLCGTLGFFFGDRFIAWLKENWWWFW